MWVHVMQELHMSHTVFCNSPGCSDVLAGGYMTVYHKRYSDREAYMLSQVTANSVCAAGRTLPRKLLPVITLAG